MTDISLLCNMKIRSCSDLITLDFVLMHLAEMEYLQPHSALNLLTLMSQVSSQRLM